MLISTHTSRVGCDEYTDLRMSDHLDFYSHIPCGMWPTSSILLMFPVIFLLTHPVWDVTKVFIIVCERTPISTHTSRVGCDDYHRQRNTHDKNFYSHIPCGMWLLLWSDLTILAVISTHTSRVGCDIQHIHIYRQLPISTHTSRVGCDWNSILFWGFCRISTHTSRVGCDRYI